MEIDIHRTEFSLSRILDDGYDFQLRLPWFRKDQVATIGFLEPITDEEQEAARRNGALHHRTESYEGLGDAELAIGWRTGGFLSDSDNLRISAGFTIPFGETEPNPWLRGDVGEEHLHILFGNGTFDPIVDAYYDFPFGEHWTASAYAKLRAPLYKNSYGYRGAVEATLSPRINYRPTPRLSLSAGATANYLGRSHWDETGTDPNSGALLAYASLGSSYQFGDAITGSLGLLLPIHTELSGEEDGLEAAPVISISVSRQF